MNRTSPNNSITFSFFVVALIDIMGQSDELSKFTTLPISKEDKAVDEFIETAKKTFGRVKFFRTQVENLRKQISKGIRVPDDLKRKLTDEQMALVKKYASPKIDVQFFSDLALLKINLMERKNHSPLISINALFTHLAILILNLLGGGIALRGAIDVGICAELGENDLYGQAVSNVYRLESEVAQYPRIVIGAPFVSYLQSFEELEVSKEEKFLVDFWRYHVRTCIEPDTDGVPILSFLAPSFVESYSKAAEIFEESIGYASAFISSEIDKFRGEDNEKLATRYQKLKNYFLLKGYWRK